MNILNCTYESIRSLSYINLNKGLKDLCARYFTLVYTRVYKNPYLYALILIIKALVMYASIGVAILSFTQTLLHTFNPIKELYYKSVIKVLSHSSFEFKIVPNPLCILARSIT